VGRGIVMVVVVVVMVMGHKRREGLKPFVLTLNEEEEVG